MCYLRPLKVEKKLKNKVVLEDKIEAYYDNKEYNLKKGDLVLVFGNLVIKKINEKKYQ